MRINKTNDKLISPSETPLQGVDTYKHLGSNVDKNGGTEILK